MMRSYFVMFASLVLGNDGSSCVAWDFVNLIPTVFPAPGKGTFDAIRKFARLHAFDLSFYARAQTCHNPGP